MELVSPSLKELWKEWQLRALVLLSLTLQIILILLGNRRKYIDKFWIKMIVWPSYLSADFVATAALGVLTSNLFANSGSLSANMELTAFWAPFLLLHLGGPDTITAYSLEDNELWSRHLIQFVVQSGFTFYILLLAWTGSLLSILAIPMLLAGLFKYGERTWVLWSASYDQRRLSRSDINVGDFLDNARDDAEDKLLAAAYALLEMTKRFFIEAPLTETDMVVSINFVKEEMSPKKAFKLVEMELGFMYDILYTKAMVTHTRWGIGLRFVSFLITCIVLVLFTVTYHQMKVYKVITFHLSPISSNNWEAEVENAR